MYNDYIEIYASYIEIYDKYVTIERGTKVLYVKLLNALYGTLKAALLFYQKLVRDLEEEGFTLNP